MRKFIKRTASKNVNGALRVIGLEIVRISKKTHNWGDVEQYIPLKETLTRARKAHLSLGEYIDAKHNVPGATQDTHDRLVALGVFNERIDRVCEIGPGSGRFLEKTLQVCKPSHYEIYETAREWADWLVSTYQVIGRPTDGMTLALTPSNSIDLVQAHKVFVCLLFLTTCSYFTEIVRVTKPGAWVIFDVMTENCLDNINVPLWLKTGINTRTYPAIIPKTFVINFFEGHGFNFLASFLVPMKPGQTECMVFRKKSS
jgi:Methyltransferase domain